MTTTISNGSTYAVDHWSDNGLAYGHHEPASSLVGTSQNWWPKVLDDLRTQFPRPARHAREHLANALSWLGELPEAFPQPAIGIAEDDTVSVEWHRSGNVLHVLFGEADAEVYFSAASGDEFETALDVGYDKVADAIRAIARA